MPHEIVTVDTLHEGWSRLLLAQIRLPDGRTMRREIEDHGMAVAVLPYDRRRRVAMLIRQFRAAVFHGGGAESVLEVPAGILDEDEPAACARREAMEETGLRLGDLEEAGIVWPMPGISTERMHLYLAPYAEADRIGKGGGVAEEHEQITLVETGLAELALMADEGRIVDLKTLALVQTLRLRHPKLF
jgi:nudix-type nucleoside diphosphatase (YffH/AdpP family)